MDHIAAMRAVRHLEYCIGGAIAFIALTALAIKVEPAFAVLGGIALYFSLMCQRMYVGWMSKARSMFTELEASDYMGITISAVLRGIVAFFVTHMLITIIVG
jgi:hypothetical protein